MRLGQSVILLPKFREQPYILDRDDCLSGEDFEQSDLVGCERPWLPSRDRDEADGDVVADHRNEQVATPPACQAGLTHHVCCVRGGLDVFDSMGTTLMDGALPGR